jgi:hypothetical protein
VRPVAKQRAACTALGETATFDLFLLNDTDKAATGTLSLSAVSPSGKLLKFGEWPAPEWTRDQFSYLVKEAFVTPKLTEEGLWRFKFAISSAPLNTQTKEIWVARGTMYGGEGVVCKALRVGVSGITPALRRQLQKDGCVEVLDFKPAETYGVIIASGLATGVSAAQNAGDTTGLEAQPAAGAPRTAARLGQLDPAVLAAVRAGTPLLAIPQTDALSDGVAKQLADAGAFTYGGNVGDTRAPWMGCWYFVRKHPVYDGMPVDQAMGIHYQAKGQAANGLMIDRAPGGAEVEIIAAYSRDHSRVIGAGTFTTKLGAGKVLYHRVPELQPVMQQRFLANAIKWLVS